MPDEYISREAALKAANEWVNEACMAPVMRVSRLFDKLAKVPAADVAEVRHGWWIYHDDDGVFTCSECGNAESNDSYYCRLCGARMDGATE